MAESTAALDDLQAASTQCATMRDCDTQRFFAAFDHLLRSPHSSPFAIDAAAGADTPDATAKPANPRPLIAALPEIGRSVALLKGRQLSDLIALNDPIKVALQQWLTQYRPNLMQAYENYTYLRYRMWPEYQKAGLPEAVLFGILAQGVRRQGACGIALGRQRSAAVHACDRFTFWPWRR